MQLFLYFLVEYIDKVNSIYPDFLLVVQSRPPLVEKYFMLFDLYDIISLLFLKHQ